MWTDLLLPIFFLVLGMVLLFIEAIVPSFGIIGIAGLLLCGAGVVTIWSAAGMVWGLLAIGISVPLFVFSLVAFFRSKASQVFVHKEHIEGGSSDVPNRQDLVGKTGTATTTLRPSGLALIEGDRYDVVTEGEWVEKGMRITVVKIGTNSIVVEKVES